MKNFQEEKQLIRDYHSRLDVDGANFERVLSQCVSSDYLWRGFHPFGQLAGSSSVANEFWHPLRAALTRVQRREDIFFAGTNRLDDDRTVWVVSMGHLMGLFDKSWLGIEPTGKLAFLRYCEFNRVEGGKICETAMYFDIPHLMMQAGQNPFPPQTGAHLVHPGPMTHDGLLYHENHPNEAEMTIKTINRMVSDLGLWDSGLPLVDELKRTWDDSMLWWGPAGIGATYTIERYAQQHSGPFRASFADRSKTEHIAYTAEGNYGGFFGWPNFTARPSGGFMGMPESGKSSEFRVIDIYRRDGDRLVENWVFIDLLHFWYGQGLDVLGRMQSLRAPK